MHHSVRAFTKWILCEKRKEWNQTSYDVWTVHCPRRKDGLIQGSENTRPLPGAGPWRNCYRAARNQGQIGPNVTGTTDIRNTLRVPLNTIIPTGRSILLRQNKPRSLTESVLWWLTSCKKFACATHSLFYWGPVCKIMPGGNRPAVRKRLPTPGIID